MARSNDLIALMGRIATYLAAKVVNAENLGPINELPTISTIDALLPYCINNLAPAKQKPKKMEELVRLYDTMD